MGIRSQIAAKSALIALLVAPQLPAQEAVGKRLSAIVGVAVEEYAKGVDSTGRLTSALELEEANGFLKEARDVASRLKGPTAAPARALIDSLALAAAQRVRPGDLRAMYGRFTTALGDAGALDLPTRAVDIARGQMVFTARCAACHGADGAKPSAPDQPILAGQFSQAVRFDPMQEFDRRSRDGNPIVPAPRDMPGRIEQQYAIGQGIAAAEVVEEPAVGNAAHPESFLNGRDAVVN